nr:MAG TPA: hypothetical protein [Caudoviricetes sp.]
MYRTLIGNLRLWRVLGPVSSIFDTKAYSMK